MGVCIAWIFAGLLTVTFLLHVFLDFGAAFGASILLLLAILWFRLPGRHYRPPSSEPFKADSVPWYC